MKKCKEHNFHNFQFTSKKIRVELHLLLPHFSFQKFTVFFGSFTIWLLNQKRKLTLSIFCANCEKFYDRKIWATYAVLGPRYWQQIVKTYGRTPFWVTFVFCKYAEIFPLSPPTRCVGGPKLLQLRAFKLNVLYWITWPWFLLGTRKFRNFSYFSSKMIFLTFWTWAQSFSTY